MSTSESDLQRRVVPYLLGYVVATSFVLPLLLLLPTAAVAVISFGGVAAMATRPEFPRREEPMPGVTPGPGWRDRSTLWAMANLRTTILVFNALLSLAVGAAALAWGATFEVAVKTTLSVYVLAVGIAYVIGRLVVRDSD